MSAVNKDNVLRIGDYISLKFPKRQAFLSAEGIMLEELYINQSTSFFEEHLFQIYTQRQYSATNELEEYLEANPDVALGKKPTDPNSLSHFEALTKGKENESNLNRAVMKSKIGNIVSFGDTIQLLHLKSNKFITIKPTDLARDERENMKATLNRDGSVMSWLKVIPRFKINREGEPITNGTEVLLRIAERPTEYLHCADRPPPKGRLREVNSSIESPTGWKVSSYQKCSDIANASSLLTGQLVYLRDPETQCFLTPLPIPISLEMPRIYMQQDSYNTDPNSNIYESPWSATDAINRIKSFKSSKSLQLTGVEMIDDDELDDAMSEFSLSSLQEFVTNYGGIALRSGNEESIDSDFLWFLESKSVIRGGPIHFRTERVQFRHFNTGKYLALEKRDEDSSDNYTLSLLNEPDEKKTHFMINELNSSSELLGNSKAVQIKHAFLGVTLQRGFYDDQLHSYACVATKSNRKAVSMILNRYGQRLSSRGQAITWQNQVESLDIYVCHAAFYHLSKYARGLVIPDAKSAAEAITIWPRMDITDRQLFSEFIARTQLFVRGYPISIKPGSDEIADMKAGKQVILRRQNMFRELGLLEAMMLMIQSLQGISDLLNAGSTIAMAKISFIELGRETLSDCLQLLFDLIRDNIENQLYIADHLLIILSHISSDKMAAKVAQELLSSNRELQETKIGFREIGIFCQRMREVHMNSMYLQLLRTCCSCQGDGVAKNQEITNNVLFKQYNDVLISVRLDYSMKAIVDWGKGLPGYDLYLGSRLGSAGFVGESLLTDGVPAIKVTWKVNSQRFSIQALYRKNEIFLSELEITSRGNHRVGPPKLGGKGAGNASASLALYANDDLKLAVHDFFVAQMYLAGEMCLDRNYPVITAMEKLYSYELLISILKSGMSENVKGSVAYLMHHLYVNREPQLETQIPRLTRTLHEITSPDYTELVYVSQPDANKFTLLQGILNFHLESLTNRAFPVHSYSMACMLHSLVKYNFYGTVDLLKDVSVALISSLKRDEFDLAGDESDLHGLSSSMRKLSLSTRGSSKRHRRESSRITSSSLAPQLSRSMSVLSDEMIQNNTSSKEVKDPSKQEETVSLVSWLVNCLKQSNSKENTEEVTAWSEPARFSKTDEYSLKTMEKIVGILNLIQTNIEDRKLSVFLKTFSAEFEAAEYRASTKNEKFSFAELSPKEVFQKIIDSASDLEISNDTFDDTYIEILMYSRGTLVQSTLDLLMAHHSSHAVLLDNISKLQLITSDADEGKYNRLASIIATLKRDSDTHEIWGKLATAEHRRISSDMHASLRELTENCKKLRETLQFDETHEPIKFIQNILRNLGGFEVCMKISRFVESVTDEMNESNNNSRALALSSNRLIVWMIKENPPNQSLAYDELKYFIKTIDSKIESHRVIAGIFTNNIELMEKVPKKHVSEFVSMICNIGRFPQYLALMSSIVSIGEKNVIANQMEVIRHISSPESQKKVAQFFVPTSHPDYAKKIRLMAPYLSVKDVNITDLPSDLAYHLDLLGLLSSCTIGRAGMTTIEAKVQSMFSFVDVIDGMLDSQCLLLGKIRLGLFLHNALLEAETPLPALKDAACIWRFFSASLDILGFAKDELRQIEKNGWDSPTSSRQKIEFVIVCILIIQSYFSLYYDYTIFRPTVGQTAVGVERIALKESQGNEIIKQLFNRIMGLYEMMSPILAREHHTIMFNTLQILNEKAKEKIVSDVENIHDSYFNSADDYDVGVEDTAGKAYEILIEKLNNDGDVKELVESQVESFITKIENLPWKDSLVKSDVRFEALIEKLVHHIRNCVEVTYDGDDMLKFMNRKSTKTSIWILKILRKMIEMRWGMTIYERDDDGGEEQDDAVAELMTVFNSSGVTEMCLDLISKGLDVALVSEALKLLVGMLFKEGGAIDIQKSIYSHLSQPGSDMFFITVKQILHNLMSWHQWNGVIVLEEGQEPDLPDEMIIVRCLQLMCEGHYLPNQDIFREQPMNNVSVNLLDEFVSYLQCLDPIKCRTSSSAENAVLATTLEVIQGPCEGNQNHFALSTELIETLNRKLRQHPVNDCDEDEEIELKKGCIAIFQALLEGQGSKPAIYERMLSVIHVDVLLVLCKGEDEDVSSKEGASSNSEKKTEEESDESKELRSATVVLLQMLCDFRPALKMELGIEDNFVEKLGVPVACIEVVWRGELQRRFFSVPDVCLLLAKSTKDNFVLSVNRASQEDKLYGLLESAKEMYREVVHQRFLKEYLLDIVFSRTNLDKITWANFYIVIAINILFLVFYVTRSVPCDSSSGFTGIGQILSFDVYDDDYSLNLKYTYCTDVFIKSSSVSFVVIILNIVLIVGATFTLMSSLVVRAPVTFRRSIDKGLNNLESCLLALSEFTTVYSFLYLVLALIGLIYHPALSVLLLDFVTLSPTSQGVLSAVYIPKKAIFMSIVLILIVIYIFAMFQFFFFTVDSADPPNFTDDQNTIRLANMFKFLLRYGLPYSSPQNQMSFTITSVRLICDVAFFIATIVLLNILKGITIDTFVEIRKKLETRLEDTTEKCFICGIEKNTFNRTLDRDAFRLHIKNDQNLWNYIFFIIHIWEQDKDDSDGLETYVRRCIDDNDLIWFPMNKAVRLAEHMKKGDVHSLKYRFQKYMEGNESSIQKRLLEFKTQMTGTIARVEKALEYEAEQERNRTRQLRSTRQSIMPTRAAAISQGHSHYDQQQPFSHSSIRFAAAASQAEINSGDVHAHKNPGASLSSPTPGTLDADSLGQLHVKIVSISGITINPNNIRNLHVRVISDFNSGIVRPVLDVLTVDTLSSPSLSKEPSATEFTSSAMASVSASINLRKSLSLNPRVYSQSYQTSPVELEQDPLVDGELSSVSQVKLAFDTFTNPGVVVHQGSLPKFGLSKLNVKFQVIFDEGDSGSSGVFLAGASIPLIELIDKASSGSFITIPFTQRQIELLIQQGGQPRNVSVLDPTPCVLTASAVASHKLVSEWSFIKSSATH